MTEVTPADVAFYLLQAPPSSWDSSSYCLPWDITPIHTLSGSRSLQIMFLGKREENGQGQLPWCKSWA